ncbi:phosphatidylinositol 4-kinase type 2-alpha [Eremomyces bilateralis CBS 781.70]|uniref:Phosphatidylinositol 4-kinase n=1 Tax=Eremomyces bilateralis CBS 781.70 TaxID=1392243 RepID=A0A6G1G0B5_9PEZI|nr:phosphatidylinositol 4-kinase type 2-alpha [Eremomyces bilateralis CBS 781.70]KAF1811494.1 phosphatidylinositol 4-kinase type 2-alpha [Eremomyces bilateralis CBS 781.70]
MRKSRPATSGYARLNQAEEESDIVGDSEDDDPFRSQKTISQSNRQYTPIQPRRHARMSSDGPRSGHRPGHRHRRSSGVDIKAINARLERWADEIASKFKIRKDRGTLNEEPLEIQHSVFQAPDWIRPADAETLETQYDDSNTRVSKEVFDGAVESVQIAIEQGVHPKLISQGSSGSYFARTAEGEIVGVFKPKDEEPYASKNPKWTKWIHRNLFPFFFGRACLIPNLSYVSEAAAYVLDMRLHTNIVPYTDIVSLSSKSFHYDYWDRRAFYRRRKALPHKVGSFQYFLTGYKDATRFLKENPWPDQNNSMLRSGTAVRKKERKRIRWTDDCRPGGRPDSDDEDNVVPNGHERNNREIFWSEELQQSFREQLEKLVILDYIMRNTDRGLDNWMIRVDRESQTASIVAEPPKENGATRLSGLFDDDEPYKREEPMSVNGITTDSETPDEKVSVSIGAIDNSLSWPWKHPDAWRSYPFGWLFLPVSLIGQPFSEATRKHFLPLLTSKQWWAETQLELRKCFMQDSDFKERMYARQIAVMKGQAWNVVETLKTPDHGPLELTRRARVCVWDDLVDVPVAMPMRPPSPEQSRRVRQVPRPRSTEEIDISAAYASEPQPDLLAFSSPVRNGESSNRFNVSRHSSSMDVRESMENSDGPLSPASVNVMVGGSQTREQNGDYGWTSRSAPFRPRLSYEGPRRSRHSQDKGRRKFSFSKRGGVPEFANQDDLEGDLGYAANEDLESHHKQVIVERLETVKSKNPVFKWC